MSNMTDRAGAAASCDYDCTIADCHRAATHEGNRCCIHSEECDCDRWPVGEYAGPPLADLYASLVESLRVAS
jgi:hypothetical protein